MGVCEAILKGQISWYISWSISIALNWLGENRFLENIQSNMIIYNLTALRKPNCEYEYTKAELGLQVGIWNIYNNQMHLKRTHAELDVFDNPYLCE